MRKSESPMVNSPRTAERQLPLEDGTLYSRRNGVEPFSVSPLQDYIPIVGEEKIDKLIKLAQRLKGVKMLEVNSTALGGGVAEMLYSQVPFLNDLGLVDEWKVICGAEPFYHVTKAIHNFLQGERGTLTSEMIKTYECTLKENADIYAADYESYKPDLVIVHDPQPLGLARYLKNGREKWVWRFHIDVEGDTRETNPALWEFINFCANFYDAAIFSNTHYVVDCWSLRRYISPPFIDPLSSKNKELSADEITKVLEKYGIEPSIPILFNIP